MVSCQRAWTLTYVSVSVSVRERSMLSRVKKGATYRTSFYLWTRTKQLRKRSAVVLYLLLGIRAKQRGRDKLNV